jgi:hypothetical protein
MRRVIAISWVLALAIMGFAIIVYTFTLFYKFYVFFGAIFAAGALTAWAFENM